MSAPTVVTLVHLGCARNLIDSELILARLAEQGLLVSGSLEDADVAVLNTCSFIGPAREESEQRLSELLARKDAGELSHVVVAGCLVQRFQRELERRFPAVDLFAEISDYAALGRAVADMTRGGAVPRYLAAGGLREAEREGARLLATPGSYAYLRISHGCDHTCSFCAIPSIRGPHRSKPLDALRSEARELIDAGVRELVLVAEDATAWGRDAGQELPALVEALAELDGEHWIRIMYAYPNRFPWGLAPLLREHPRVVPYLDIPVQHAATPVLRAMRRAGSGDQVRAILDRLRDEVPGITLRTTLLVGFPGETERDVDELERFVREYRLGRMGVFGYSPEEGTAGFDLDGELPADEIEARRERILAARDAALDEAQRELVGTEQEVLIDEAGDEVAVARGVQDAPEVDLVTLVQGCEAPVGARVAVRVEGLDEEGNAVAVPVAAGTPLRSPGGAR
ncbi:MAG: 30S ribosomal protein S12 methylthiotransferase RimO [Planctomycetota bacterium]